MEDCAVGILKLLERGTIGEVYNLGSQIERKNIDTVKLLLKALKKDKTMIEFVKDRPGHDLRYSLDSSKVFQEIEWKIGSGFQAGLETTVAWYLAHRNWLLAKRKEVLQLYRRKQL